MNGHRACPKAVEGLKGEGYLSWGYRCRTARYLDNKLEQDQRRVRKQIEPKQGFRSLEGARRTIAGYEAVEKIWKG